MWVPISVTEAQLIETPLPERVVASKDLEDIVSRTVGTAFTHADGHDAIQPAVSGRCGLERGLLSHWLRACPMRFV